VRHFWFLTKYFVEGIEDLFLFKIKMLFWLTSQEE
jgi:hypothetical protein